MKAEYPALYFSYKILRDIIRDRKFAGEVVENYRRGNEAVRKNLPLITELVIGTLRWWYRFEFYTSILTKRKIQRRVRILLHLGFYQLEFTRLDNEKILTSIATVSGRLFSKEITGFLIGVLRNYLRNQDKLFDMIEDEAKRGNLTPKYAFPRLYTRYMTTMLENREGLFEFLNGRAPLYIKAFDIERAKRVLESKNVHYNECDIPPGCLRVDAPSYIIRKLMGKDLIIQDRGSQLIAWLLRFPPGTRVLDCCSAPGWKSLSVLHNNREVEITLLEKSRSRLSTFEKMVQEDCHNNLKIIYDDVRKKRWLDTGGFDHIIADVPCSNSGVVRRHPEKKLFLEEKDLFELVKQQREILSSLYPVIRRGGFLLYITCSLFSVENEDQIEWMTHTFPSMKLLSMGYVDPRTFNSDGFFVALLQKN